MTTRWVEVPEGRKLDTVIAHARKFAVREGVGVLITRTYEVKGRTLAKPILEVGPRGDIGEVLAPRLKVPIGMQVLEQFLWLVDQKGMPRASRSPAASVLKAFNERAEEGKRK